MKKTILAGIFACFLMQCLWGAPPTVAVLDLAPKAGFVKAEAEQVSDIIRSNFVNTRKFTVLERSQMNQILSEQEFSVGNAAENTQSAVQVGKLVAADYVVVGTIGRLLGKISINVRMINVSTGKVDAAESAMTTDDTLFNDLSKLCSTLAGASLGQGEKVASGETKAETVPTKAAPQTPDFTKNSIGLAAGYENFYGYDSWALAIKYERMFLPWLGISAGAGGGPDGVFLSVGPFFRLGFFGIYPTLDLLIPAGMGLGIGIDFKIGTISLFAQMAIAPGSSSSSSGVIVAGIAYNF